jgi:hypothetical protein
MVGTVAVPPRAAFAVLQLGATNFGKEDSILFRDVRLVPVEE